MLFRRSHLLTSFDETLSRARVRGGHCLVPNSQNGEFRPRAHTDIGPTIMALLGLRDDYTHDGTAGCSLRHSTRVDPRLCFDCLVVYAQPRCLPTEFKKCSIGR